MSSAIEPADILVVREPGYYWVKPVENDNWEVAEWDGAGWWRTGSEMDWRDDTWGFVGPLLSPP